MKFQTHLQQMHSKMNANKATAKRAATTMADSMNMQSDSGPGVSHQDK